MGRRTGPSREPDGGAALPAAPTDDDLCASARELGADGRADVLVASMTSAVRVLESCVHGRVVLVTRAGCGHRPVLDPHSFGGATPERLPQRRGLRGKLHLASDRFHLWSGLKGGDCIGDLGITHGGDPGECFATERTRQLSGGRGAPMATWRSPGSSPSATSPRSALTGATVNSEPPVADSGASNRRYSPLVVLGAVVGGP